MSAADLNITSDEGATTTMMTGGDEIVDAVDPSRAQFLVMILTFGSCSLVSLVSSISIVTIVSRNLRKLYHRILLMISLSDAILSFTNMFHLILAPQHKTINPFVIGNDASCAAMGFFLNTCLLCTSVYNAFLSINFLLQVRYKWTEEQITKRIEIFVHVFAASFSLPLPMLAASLRSFNPEFISGLCLMKEYPAGCHADELVECESGEKFGSLLAISAAGMIYIVAIIGFVSVTMLYRTVRSTIHKTSVTRFSSAPQESTTSTSSSADGVCMEMDSKQKRRLRRVSWQCSMYALAYLNTIIWPLFHQIIGRTWDMEHKLGEPGKFVAVLVPFIFFPLQGFLNFVIFITPRYQQWRSCLPDEPWTYVLRCAVSPDDPPCGNRRGTANLGSTKVSQGGGCSRSLRVSER
mmetsp:Transcript_10360/g.29531  ORF Transcript_10360/g.29531 Transcript_10360/m.29531 type:complete len:408 (-) Transcript_10360:1527-2750(-)